MAQAQVDPLLAELDAYRKGATPAAAPAGAQQSAASASGDAFLDELNSYRQRPAIEYSEGPPTAEQAAYPRVEIAGTADSKASAPGYPGLILDAGLGVLRGGKNLIDAGAHGLAWGYDKLNHALGGSSHEYDDVRAADDAGQQQFKSWFRNPQEQAWANGGVAAGEIGGAMLLPELKVLQGATLAPRIVNGAVNGGIANMLMGDADPNSSAAGNAAIGGLVGGTVGAVLPPVLSKVGSQLQRAFGRTGSGVAPALDAATAADAQAAQAAGKQRFKMNADGTVSSADSASIPVPPMRPLNSVADAGKLSQVEQQQRAAVLDRIGLDTKRPSTLSGDKFASGNEYQTSLLENPSGQLMRDQLAKEQGAINNFADKLVSDTGGTPNAAPANRGGAILAPLKGLSDWFDTNIGGLYQAARDKAGTLGTVTPQNLSALLKDNNFREGFLTSADGTALLNAIDRQVKRFQGLPVEGEAAAAAPNTVNSAENLRKWLNDQWTPRNSRALGQIKNALDMDVAAVGGADVFNQARKLHALRMNTLDNPNGIASILQESGPDGINRTVPLERIADRIASMPDAQFGHIVDTLRNNVPREIAPQAQQALNEVRAQLAEQLVNAGRGTGQNQWNAVSFNRAANQLQGKLGKVFSADELANIKALHDAGYILNTPKAYPGAAAQAYNMWQRGALTGLPSLGAAIGGGIAGGGGAAVGAGLGGAAAKVVKGAADKSNAARLAEMLSNPAPAMEDTAGRRIGLALSRGLTPAPFVNATLLEALRNR